MRKFRILLAFLALLMSAQLSASHLLGGEIYWECTPNGRYIFTLVLYRDCTGINIPTTPQTINGPVTITANYISAESGDVTPPCGDPNFALACSAGDEGAIEKGVYRSGPVTLTGTPPPGGWEFSWTSCCRPQLENTNASGYYLRSVMYPYTPPGATQPLTVNQCYDNSPQFGQDANGVTCPGFKYTFNHLPSDKDIDSLVFDWANPLDGANSPISWSSGFSNTAPFPDGTENALNGPNTVDRFSGEMTMEAYSPSDGWYTSCVVIQEYRCGQLIGEVYRDVPFAFLDAAICQANNSTPSAEIDTSVYQNVRRNGNVYNIQVYPQDTVQFRLTGQDLDQFSNGFFQTICMKSGGLQLNSNNPASTTGCDGAAPCATLTSQNANGTYCNTIQNTVEFFWVPDCVHLNFGGCGSASNTYFFTIRMQDDGCAAPKVGLATVVIEVLAGDPNPPGLSCASVNFDGSVDLSWSQPPLDSALDFNYYRIYGSNSPTGPWSVVDSITNYNQLSTNVPSQGNVSYFWMQMSTGPCDFLSQPSDTLRTMTMTLNAVPAGSPEYAQLSWTPLRPSGGLPNTTNGVYEIWIEAPSQSNNWTKVGETTNLSFTDTVSVCDLNVTYQIRVLDTVTNCYSGSIQDTGTFQDRTNNFNPEVARVFVDGDNNAAIEWDTDSVEDIVAFYLLFNDPRDGWVVVDTIAAGTPSPYVWPGSQADTRSEEFKVISVDSCGNESDDLAVNPNNTVYLRNYLDKCNGTSRISWNSYNEFPNGVHGYRIYLQITEDDGTVIPQTLYATAAPGDTSFLQDEVRRDFTYCYIVEAFDTIAGLTSTSNELCVDAEVLNKSRRLYIASVTNDFGREALDVTIYIDGEADVQRFEVERAPEFYGPYKRISTIQKPGAPPYILRFQDFGVRPDRLDYYYRAIAIDSCGGRDTISNVSRNFRLRVSPKPDLTNRLVWTSYQGWGGDVARYEVFRRENNSGNFIKVGETLGDDTTYTDYDIADLIQADPENGRFCYYIRAVEGPNPNGFVTNTGDPFSALSNQECVNQQARMFMATAFRPNSNVPENRLFGPALELDDVDEFHFYIMNRWGKKVFETKDPTTKWDGTYQGQEAQAGVYVYYVKYATPGDKAQEERGNFTLVR